MNTRQREQLDRVLEIQLERTLAPPEVPTHFRAGLQAALAREQTSDLSEVRLRFEREWHEQLAELRWHYLKLQRRTLGFMMGGALAAGAFVAVGLPWLTIHLGPLAPLVAASMGVAAGSWIGVVWLLRFREVLAPV